MMIRVSLQNALRPARSSGEMIWMVFITAQYILLDLISARSMGAGDFFFSMPQVTGQEE